MAILQAGRHIARVTAVSIEEPENKTPFIALDFAKDGDVITGYLYLSEKAFDNTVKVLSDVFNFDGNFDTIEGQTVGKDAAITVEDDEYNGKTRPKVKWINAPRESAPASKNFRAQLSAKARAIVGNRPVARPAAKPAPAPTHDEDPF